MRKGEKEKEKKQKERIREGRRRASDIIGIGK